MSRESGPRIESTDMLDMAVKSVDDSVIRACRSQTPILVQ